MQQINPFHRQLNSRFKRRRRFKHLSRRTGVVICLVAMLSLGIGCQRDAYLYTSFHEPANEGLRFLYSEDGYHWDSLPGIFLTPDIGSDKIMRDPSMVQGPDGTFHLVWTIAWKGNSGFGYASSRDLIHWSQEKVIPVMQHEKTTVNVWAPELFYRKDKKDFLIVWASTIPFRFEKGLEDEDNNHRLYYTITKDFNHFSPAKLYYDPGYSSIDATIVQRGKYDFVLVFKDNTRLSRNIKVAFGKTALGPFSDTSSALTPMYSEGPSVAKVKNNYLIYYDWYRKGKFGAISTRDFHHFKNATQEVNVPANHKHGTILKVSRHFLKELKKKKGIQ